MKSHIMLLPLVLTLAACATNPEAPMSAETPAANAVKAEMTIGEIADAYIKLTLEAGTHEAEYVDAYYGPPALQEAAKAMPRPAGRGWRRY